jgi:hypothetical protein
VQEPEHKHQFSKRWENKIWMYFFNLEIFTTPGITGLNKNISNTLYMKSLTKTKLSLNFTKDNHSHTFLMIMISAQIMPTRDQTQQSMPIKLTQAQLKSFKIIVQSKGSTTVTIFLL